MNWIKITDRLPETGTWVLVWHEGKGIGYGLKLLDEKTGRWAGQAADTEISPSHWMPLPGPPVDTTKTIPGGDSPCDIIDGRLILDIDKQRELVASLMQHYLNGDGALINGKTYFVTDIRNEMIDEHMASIFYLKPA